MTVQITKFGEFRVGEPDREVRKIRKFRLTEGNDNRRSLVKLQCDLTPRGIMRKAAPQK